MAPPPPRRRNDGILSDPIDLDGPRNPRTQHPVVPARAGLVVKQRGTPISGTVVGVVNGYLHVKDRRGYEHRMTMLKGGFEVDGKIVTLVEPRSPAPGSAAPAARTASGSIAVPRAPAQVAKASRILVEGLHDAELVEKVWGDDLRAEGVVVEQLDGADHLDEIVRAFAPRPGRRLGILLDHLVDGSKETRIAASVSGHADVLVTGHPYVDVWQAVKPSVIGLQAWPEVPRGEPWKEGLMARIGVEGEPGRFWKYLLGKVSTWTDLEPPLIGAVEQLIDFVTEPPPA